MAMNFAEADLTPEPELNEIVWKSVRGAHSPMPPPVRAGFIRIIESERKRQQSEEAGQRHKRETVARSVSSGGNLERCGQRQDPRLMLQRSWNLGQVRVGIDQLGGGPTVQRTHHNGTDDDITDAFTIHPDRFEVPRELNDHVRSRRHHLYLPGSAGDRLDQPPNVVRSPGLRR